MDKKRINPLWLWIIFAILFILGFVLLYLINNVENQKPILILAAVVFILMTFSLQAATTRTFRYKHKTPNYIKRYYKDTSVSSIEKNLLKDQFEKREPSFGCVYSKVVKDVFYKVVVIYDSSLYFNSVNKEPEETKPTKGIDKCTKMIGFEIFLSKDEEIIKKSPDFSFQGTNILYEGFYYDNENNMIVEPNVLEVNDYHLENYNYLKNLVGFTEEIIL